MKDINKTYDLIFTMIKNTKFEYKSEEYLEFRDITQDVEDFVKKSGINNGQVLVYSMHTTLAIRVNEKEAGIVKDFRGLIARLIPRDTYYCHNDLSIRTENLVCQSGAPCIGPIKNIIISLFSSNVATLL